jgi:hypothetical protein
MQISYLDTSKYNRFFAFGCSFTNYIWPMWADIIGREIPCYENWGKGGAGNQFIFNSVIECNLRNHFTDGDLIMIMWTSCSREDRYVNDSWLVAATEGRESIYGKEWMRKFGNQGKGLMIRDFATIDGMHKVMNSLESDWVSMNSLPLIRFDIDRAEKEVREGKITVEELEQRWSTQQKLLSYGSKHRDEYLSDCEVIDLYQDIFLDIKEPLYDRISREKRPNSGDLHPSPSESLSYLNDVIPNNLNSSKFVSEWDSIVYAEAPIKYFRNKIPIRF